VGQGNYYEQTTYTKTRKSFPATPVGTPETTENIRVAGFRRTNNVFFQKPLFRE